MSLISNLNEKAFPFEGKGVLLWTLVLFFLVVMVGSLSFSKCCQCIHLQTQFRS